jgi:hypothetical protein
METKDSLGNENGNELERKAILGNEGAILETHWKLMAIPTETETFEFSRGRSFLID